ncbi:MAG TPA: TlpA disulfide reductase family protein [Actinoplanes sp.]|jgi:thiol-disulfide isomerase/thioredoxin|nr:TlpA disulfide reductase family protein [Actinoplanes sp.]
MSRLPGALVALVVAAALLLSGCTSTPARDRSAGAAPAPSGPSCLPVPASTSPTGLAAGPASPAGLVSGPASPPAIPTGPAAGASGAGEPLPDLALPCFVGGQPVRLAHLGTPAVVNLWASWCQPCRTELPQIQRYAQRAAGRVQVVGVITSDPVRNRPQSVVDDFGLRFPMLYDDKAALQTGVGARLLPMTLFVDAQGRVVYRYNSRPLDEATLAELVQRHLGVTA